MIVLFYSPNHKEEEIIRKIIPTEWEENNINVFNILNFDAKKIIERYKKSNTTVITFGKIARKSLVNNIEDLLELPTALEIEKKYTAKQKIDLMQKIKELLEREKELSSFTNIKEIDTSILEGIDKEKIFAAVLSKKDKKTN